MVSLTGSVAAGQQIMTAAAVNITKVSLELGGKAPAIVMADANIDLAVKCIILRSIYTPKKTIQIPRTLQYQKPRKNGELHLILVDNGRSESLANEDHIQTLKCIRCGACMNTCPVYRRSGGYSYSYFIPGPIGINLGMLKSPKDYYSNLTACTLCFSCNNVCPVKIDIGNQIYKWRQELDSIGKANLVKKTISSGMKFAFYHSGVFNAALKMAPITNTLPRSLLYIKADKWGIGRDLPLFTKQSFTSWWKQNNLEK